MRGGSGNELRTRGRTRRPNPFIGGQRPFRAKSCIVSRGRVDLATEQPSRTRRRGATDRRPEDVRRCSLSEMAIAQIHSASVQSSSGFGTRDLWRQQGTSLFHVAARQEQFDE